MQSQKCENCGQQVFETGRNTYNSRGHHMVLGRYHCMSEEAFRKFMLNYLDDNRSELPYPHLAEMIQLQEKSGHAWLMAELVNRLRRLA